MRSLEKAERAQTQRLKDRVEATELESLVPHRSLTSTGTVLLGLVLLGDLCGFARQSK